MTQTVSALSIVAMVLTAVVSICIPVAAFIIINKKTKCRQTCVLVGAGTFIVFALILETLLNQLVFRIFGEKLTDNIWLYALYGGLAAGLFEETGRLISMKLFMKKDLTKTNALMYGVGHGGAEMFLLVGLTYISNVIISVIINMGKFEMLLTGIDESMRKQVVEQISALWTTPAHQFLLAGVERALAFVLQLCLSYIVYRAVKDKKPLLYVLAVLLHFFVDASLVVLMKFVSVYIVEAVLLAMVFCVVLLTFKKYKTEKDEITKAEEIPLTE